MARTVLSDAFAHHAWATAVLLDALASLDDAQLAHRVEGTYGSILDTMRHLVAADSGYLWLISGQRHPTFDASGSAIPDLRRQMAVNEAAWAALVAQPLDADTVLTRRRDDGSEYHAPLGVRLAQALHHGTDHRSQVCTALTALGLEPPDIDVWAYGEASGRCSEVPATSG